MFVRYARRCALELGGSVSSWESSLRSEVASLVRGGQLYADAVGQLARSRCVNGPAVGGVVSAVFSDHLGGSSVVSDTFGFVDVRNICVMFLLVGFIFVIGFFVFGLRW